MSSENILARIAGMRRKRIDSEGHTLGAKVPEQRQVPLVPFAGDPAIICEIKRGSPSKGIIDAKLDPAAQAGRYFAAGVRSVSVLTEEDHFGGSLNDLVLVKQTFPDLAVLRKEFILDEEDLSISFRAGADAVLLIASLLDRETLERLYRKCRELGMQPLVEVHDAEDVAKARLFRPELTGINSRDLTTFRTDLLLPLHVASMIDWETRLIYESGISWGEDIQLARTAGFSGVLIGETVVRHPERLPGLVAAASAHVTSVRFWREIMRKRADHPRRPLVKICGLTNAEDAAAADSLGADILGFVFAESPRRADAAVVEALKETRALKVAVVVTDENDGRVPGEVERLLQQGHLDAVQFHGDEEPEICRDLAFPYYKAVRVGSGEDLKAARMFRSPRILLDARVPGVRGGSGVQVDAALARKAAETAPLWLAGGINAANAALLAQSLEPELLDLSSGVESSPGKKDHDLLRRLFAALDNL